MTSRDLASAESQALLTLSLCPTLAARGSGTVFWESGREKTSAGVWGSYSLQVTLKQLETDER